MSENVPQIPIRLPGTLWGLTSFFNPENYENKKTNYRRFRASSKKQGLKLLCLELAFGDRPFELTEKDADILIQLRTESVLWQKERLLNIGLEKLPVDCDKVAWLDADVVFLNDNWIRETSELLEKYAIVQPFEWSVRLPKGEVSDNILAEMLDCQKLEKETGFGFYYANHFSQVPWDKLEKPFAGHAGFAWAGRRDLLKQVGFYDRAIVGSGDGIMAYGFIGVDYLSLVRDLVYPEEITSGQTEWREKSSSLVLGSVYFASGGLCHLWHGDISKRSYRYRDKILIDNNFCPKRDLSLSSDGLWILSPQKKGLQSLIEFYFYSRNEEGVSSVNQKCLNETGKSSWLYCQRHLPKYLDYLFGVWGMFLRRWLPRIYVRLKRVEQILKKYF